MSGALQFGILGTGNIAGQFAEGVAGAKRSAVAAVGSRSRKTADGFAAKYDIQNAHASYDALLEDDSVEAVYVSLPNSMHHEWTIKALEAGKHVLCEKPLACNADQAREMFDTAADCDRLLVEAFMYRSHPLTHAVLAKLREGAIGEVRLVRTSFCYFTSRVDGNIRFDASLAGGALMDIGCYCIDFARLMIGAEPTRVHALGHLHTTGVDDLAGATLQFENGALASMTCGMQVHADNAAYICGSAGYIIVPVPWKPPVEDATFTIACSTPPRMDQNAAAPPPGPETIAISADRPLYALEADDFAAAVRDGAAPAMSRDDSLSLMRVLDDMRRQVGAAV